MNAIQKRQLASLIYVTPEYLELSVRPTVVAILQKSEKVKHLSGDQKKKYLEKHHAANLGLMFKHGASSTADVTVCVHEQDDFDCVLKLVHATKGVAYKPVQLKQVPYNVNGHADIQTEINKLKKYTSSSELMVAFWINRDVKFDLRDLDFDGLGIEQLYFLGVKPSGVVTLHGGPVPDLVSGVCWTRIASNGTLETKPVRFKPKL